MAETVINLENTDQALALFGNYDENINLLQRQYNVAVLNRGNDIRISGGETEVAKAKSAVEALIELIKRGEHINEQSIRYVNSMVDEGMQQQITQLADGGICVTASGKVVKAKTLGQKKYVDAIGKNTIVMGVGPAGTGKTYLAVAMAVKAFKAHEVTKIILTRP
ncbi:MAG: PhoH family protein, partial [Oscillospiraceae bacterium]|nr:PhoH family protein [Oscillospiraceae bacterium]